MMVNVVSLKKPLFRTLLAVLCVFFSNNIVQAQTITADFTSNAVICGSANVNFAATVIGSIPLSDLRFTWDFGDSKPGKTGQNVSNGFPVTPGSTHLVSGVEAPFHVTLTVTRISTNTVVATKTNDVLIRPAPVPVLQDASLSVKPFDNCANNPTITKPFYVVTVNNQSQDVNTISGYTLDWGDGSSVSAYVRIDIPITHTYNKLGLFKLKLTATGVNGCTATTIYNVKNLGNPAIGISSGGNTTGCAPITFGFKVNNIQNNDPQTTYIWDFGDGTTRTWTIDSINNAKDTTVFHTYTTSSCNQTNGYFIVKITATNACQSTEASVGGVRVGSKPIPNFSASNLCEGEPVNLQNTTATGSNFDCSLGVIYKWDFGDGTTLITTNPGVIPHTFPAGTSVFNVKLTAVNDCKDSASFSQQVTLIRRPIAIATLTPLTGCAPLTVVTANASTGDNITSNWSVAPNTGWSFTTGFNANSISPGFIFATKGNYVVTLRETNTCAYNEKTFNVFVNGPINVTFPDIANQCTAYTFDASMTSVFRLTTITNEVVQANWTVTPSTGFTYLNGTTAQSLYPQIKFETEGDYTISVTLTNGCDTKTITKTFKFAFSPKAIATASATEGCIPINNVHFDNQSTGYQAVSTWSITPSAGAAFVNGTSSASLSPDIQFTQAGNYTVKLTVTNSCGINTTSFIIKAKDQPTVNLNAVPNICLNGTVTFNSALLTVSSNNGSALTYNWTISPNTGFTYQNSTTSTSANPSYQFTVEGTYQVSVAVTNDCGTVTKTRTFDVRPAAVLVTAANDSAGCAPKSISFTDNSTGDQLTHKWTVIPATGFTYTTGSSTSAAPTIQFTQAGTYAVTHALTGLCNMQSKTFIIEISTIPAINLSSIANQCTLPFNLLIDSTKFSLNQNGKALSNIHWWTTPATGVTFIDGTTLNSKYPHLSFSNSGQYTVWVETENDCGKSTASQIFWIPEHAVEKSISTPLTGCMPLTVNFTDQSTGDLLVHSWTVTPATGWTMTPPAAAASPKIVFTKVGIYTVTHRITNSCGTDSHIYSVKVKDVPTVTLGLKTSSCNSYTYVADNLNMKLVTNLNDTISYLWTITPFRAITYLNSSSDTSHYPVIQFADTGRFFVTVKTLGECGFTETHQTISITKGPEILLTPILSTKCMPSDLTFTGTVYGQNLVYNWTVTPSAGASYINGTTSTSPLPQIRFTRPGNYSVSLNASNNCSNDIKKWDYTIVTKPTILFNAIADTCDNYKFLAERYIVVQDNGNAVSGNAWTITPATGFSYVDGTSATSPLPHILFSSANTYQITMNATNDCGTTSISRSFTLDQFQKVEAGADTILCTNNTLYPLNGLPFGGSWSILPASASGVLKLIGSSYYLDLNVPGSYTLTYKRGSAYCGSQDSRRFTVLALPVVDAGLDFSLCENDKTPHLLTGTPVGGIWSGNGVTGNTFLTTGLTAGSYILKYTWTDPATTCSNTDQLVARLIAVPLTGFTVLAQSCKDLPVLFTPNGAAGTVYNWDFGDGQTAISSGTINHTYRAGGTFTVKMISADPNNCSTTTTSKIVILDDIKLPVVKISPNKGCGPLTVNFTVDTIGTTGNGQSYSWNFGNGQLLNGAFTSKDIIFNQALKDTTYNVILTISNACFTNSVVYPIIVNSKPNANFGLQHPWECSPKIITIKNLSTDRTALFHWDFGDGTTSTVYEPTHTYTTGKVATTYMIKLVAQNMCGKDSITRPILIKPNSIEAYIQMDTRQACPGIPVTFTNLSSDTVLQIMNYYWDFGDGTISNTWNATHAYAAEGKYTIKLFIDNGCSTAQTTDTIRIFPPLTLWITARDSVCIGESLYFEGKSPLGVLINTKWDFGDGAFSSGITTNHIFMTPGWNIVTFTAATATNISHCTGLVTKRIYVKALPPVAPVNDIEGCSPVKISLKPAGLEPQLWNFGEDSVWTSSGTHTFINNNTDNKPIRRKVSTITENTFGCRSLSFFWVTIYPVPKAKIRVNSIGGLPESVFLSSLSTNATACEWLFPDGTSSLGCDSVLIKLYNNGFYKIQLRSSNQYGCWDTTSVVHETIIKGLFVPNAFQPSHANSLINTFKPVGIGLKSYWLGVYDTWDNLIWETNKLLEGVPVEGWDGSTSKGKKLTMDVYIWRAKAVFIDGTEWKGMKGRNGILRTEGTVTLIK
jgi:PKD repeat protein